MNTIVSVDLNWGIGYNNDLLFHVREDMLYFKSKTVGKVVVMGENTFYSLPNQKPLKDRINVVLSDKKELKIDGVTVCNSLDELQIHLEQYSTEDIFIVGGQAIYALMLPYCNIAYITQFYAGAVADKYFPNLAASSEWKLAEKSEPIENNGLKFTFDIYKRV